MQVTHACIGRLAQSAECRHCNIREVVAGVIITGNHNNIQSGAGFTIRGNHNNIGAGCVCVRIEGDHNNMLGSDSILIGQHINDRGVNNIISLPSNGSQTRINTPRQQRPLFHEVFYNNASSSSSSSNDRRPPPPAPASAATTTTTYPDPINDEPSAPEDTADEKVCKVCMDRAIATVAVPCGHSYACVTCIVQAKPKDCALCRKPLEKVIRVFLQ